MSGRVPLRLPSRRATALAVVAVLVTGWALGSAGRPTAPAAERARLAVAVAAPQAAPAAAPAAVTPAPAATAPIVPVDPPGAPAATPAEPTTTPDTATPAADAPDTTTTPTPATAPTPTPTPTTLPTMRHVWFVVLADQREDVLYDPAGPARYLNGTLRPKGVLLSHLYAIAHESLASTVALVSGLVTTPVTRGNCPHYGAECLQPVGTPTIASQLEQAGDRWRVYAESTDAHAAGVAAGCRHPEPNAADPWQGARPGDPYVTWRDPFLYFHGVIDDPACATDVVGLDALAGDLADPAATPAFSYVVPDLCHDGRTEPCAPGAPSGTAAADAWLRTVLPGILASKAYREDGLVVITSDQAPSTGTGADLRACCGLPLPGGGRVGALLLSPFADPGAESTDRLSQLSLLRLAQDALGLDPLGQADAGDLPRVDPSLLGRTPAPTARSQQVHGASTLR